jgi:hypothetical protein
MSPTSMHSVITRTYSGRLSPAPALRLIQLPVIPDWGEHQRLPRREEGTKAEEISPILQKLTAKPRDFFRLEPHHNVELRVLGIAYGRVCEFFAHTRSPAPSGWLGRKYLTA